MTDFGEGKWVNGRKRHQCAACRGPIPQGEVHFNFKGMWEGDWQNWRLHAECHDAWQNDGCDEVGDDYPVPERLKESSNG